MTEISSTTAPPATTGAHTAAGSGTTALSNPKATLDKDGFLKLFITQLQHQDPSAPMDASESVAQMAQFSMVEGMNNMQTTNSSIASSLNTSSAVGLIGRTVSYVDDKGDLQTGKVDRVATTKDGKATLTVAGKPGIDPSLIAEVSA
jgi:flagellar basal-body rod modification protein FlgD